AGIYSSYLVRAVEDKPIYKCLLTDTNTLILLSSIVRERIIPLLWLYGSIEVAMQFLKGFKDPVPKRFLSDLVLISCKHMSFYELEVLFGNYGRIPVDSAAIIFLVSHGMISLIEYVEKNLDPGCNIIEAIRYTSLRESTSQLMVSTYARWLTTRGMISLISFAPMAQMISLLVKYEDLTNLKDVLFQLPPVETSARILDKIFINSSPSFLKKLVKEGVITGEKLSLFIGHNQYLTDRLAILLNASEELGKEDAKHFVLSLLDQCAINNDNFGVEIM